MNDTWKKFNLESDRNTYVFKYETGLRPNDELIIFALNPNWKIPVRILMDFSGYVVCIMLTPF